MFPGSLYPPSCFPGPLYPGAGKGGSGSGTTTVVSGFPGSLFPQPVFPASLFPASLFPKSTSTSPTTSPVLFENELANFIRSGLGINAYPMVIPAEVTTYPQITYTIIDGGSEQGLFGPTGQAWRNVQLDAYSIRFIDVVATSEAIRKLFVPFMRGPGSMGRIFVTAIVLGRPGTDAYQPISRSSPSAMNRYTFDYTFYYYESLP